MSDNDGSTAGIVTALVVAVAENGVIGRGGGLPWRIPTDLMRFRRLTMGKPIIMGRRTFQSLGKPLDGRDNIVVSGDARFAAPGAHVVGSIEDALELARRLARERGAKEIMVIGGAQIYRAAVAHADRMYLTEVHGQPAGDTTLPDIGAAEWREVSRESLPRDPRDEYACTLRTFERER